LQSIHYRGNVTENSLILQHHVKQQYKSSIQQALVLDKKEDVFWPKWIWIILVLIQNLQKLLCHMVVQCSVSERSTQAETKLLKL